MDDLRQVELVVAAGNPGESELIKQVLAAAGMRYVRIAATAQQALAICGRHTPDMAIVGLEIAGVPAQMFLNALRRGEREANRYLPVGIALSKPDARSVATAVQLGAHEVIALPTSVKAITGLVRRAVIVGRPFVETARYIGPCRRRREMVRPGPERRQNWAGYTHAAHRPMDMG